MTPKGVDLVERFLKRVRPLHTVPNIGEGRVCAVCRFRPAVFFWRQMFLACRECALQIFMQRKPTNRIVQDRLAVPYGPRNTTPCVLCERPVRSTKVAELPNHDPRGMPHDFAHKTCLASVLSCAGVEALVAIG